jgi:UDP-N-acetylglucosamine--N-acetylmuramyl-(pentapeptide) pyrophosphoryl-undecaprenol N-acetylglucosamine transferase
MNTALNRADLAIARSGCGTIAELALFGIPAIFVPLPTSFADHQRQNALEIQDLGGGQVLEQSDIGSLERVWRDWRSDPQKRRRAAEALRAWAIPDAAPRVLQVVQEAAE